MRFSSNLITIISPLKKQSHFKDKKSPGTICEDGHRGKTIQSKELTHPYPLPVGRGMSRHNLSRFPLSSPTQASEHWVSRTGMEKV